MDRWLTSGIDLTATNRWLNESASMNPITFFVAGVPKGQPRVKAYKRGAHAGVYDPGTADGWKLQVSISGKQFVPDAPLTGPLRVDLAFYFPRPKGHFRTGKHAGVMRDTAPMWHTSRPDFDNLAKAVCDQLTVTRFWGGDTQVCDGRILKAYEDGRGPGCQVTITPL